MKVVYNQEKIDKFSEVVFSQNFTQYYGMTNTYKNFEDQNLTPLIKASVLKKLSVTNHLNVPSFEDFFDWIRKKHGTELSIILSRFIFPKDDKLFNYLKNSMRNDRNHELWMHVKARIYKKWCSIVTEMQCVYAIVQGVDNLDLDWDIIVSPELDSIGIDFVVVKYQDGENIAYPIQIKKDSFSVYAQKKYNALENFDKVTIKKKALAQLTQELNKQKITANIQDITILKYGVTSSADLPYEYLKRAPNGFVYYDADLLVKALNLHLI